MYLGYLLFLAMGFVLGLMGAGGAILTVPILVYVFKIDALQATGYSLFIVGAVALVGFRKYFINKNVSLELVYKFGFFSVMGVFLSRALILPSIPEIIFSYGNFILTKKFAIMSIFSFLMMKAAFSMLSNTATAQRKEMSSVRYAILGLGIGIISGFVGAGGGFLIIPVLVSYLGLDAKQAIGTSLGIIALQSLLGFLADVSMSESMDWSFLFLAIAISVGGMQVGVLFSEKISSQKMKKAFGFFLIIISISILFKEVIEL